MSGKSNQVSQDLVIRHEEFRETVSKNLQKHKDHGYYEQYILKVSNFYVLGNKQNKTTSFASSLQELSEMLPY